MRLTDRGFYVAVALAVVALCLAAWLVETIAGNSLAMQAFLGLLIAGAIWGGARWIERG